MVEHKKIKCHVMTMYDWLKKNYPEVIDSYGVPYYCPFTSFFGLICDSSHDSCLKNGGKGCIECWQRPFRGIKNDKR